MKALELLAPARNVEIGIAAIDCGADAVYIAGPSFGARKDAPNSLEEIARLCEYAHRFGARIFLTVNTIIFENELEQARSLMLAAQDAGVDAFIVQDMALTRFEGIRVPLHASTQCAIRTVEKAKWLASLGFGRLVLERELPLGQIRAIAEAVPCEIEAFVHGALCVCYSGQCYMSEALSGRSANRGECIQACRSLYDLTDASGKVLARNKALLSLKDLNLSERLEDMAEAGVTSFKIEGRLKNISYVRNVVRQYSLALDALVAAHPDQYRKSSFGSVSGGFTPAPEKTFNRGYTSLYIDGKRDRWASPDTPKSVGEKIGTVAMVRPLKPFGMEIRVKPSSDRLVLSNGDGFTVQTASGLTGFRGDVCEGLYIRCKTVPGIKVGDIIYRNSDLAFEREMERKACKRELGVVLDIRISGKFSIDFTARCEDGREVTSPFKADPEVAENRDRALEMMRSQLSKRALDYSFTVGEIVVETPGGALPLLGAATLNAMRRLIASDLDSVPRSPIPMYEGERSVQPLPYPEEKNYKANVANPLAAEVIGAGVDTVAGADAIGAAGAVDQAFEISHARGAELMRTRYCIRYELGLCPRHQGAADSGPLFLENNGRRFALGFDCRRCEMTVSDCR